MKFTILLDPSLVIITIHIVCLNHAPEKRKDSYEIHKCYTFYPYTTFPWGGGYAIYFFLSPYPTDASVQIWLMLAQ